MLQILCLLAVIALASASDVLVFDDNNFEDSVAEHDIVLVEFYAPWCGHCKRLAPEYEKAATTLKNHDPPIALAKVDCTAETKACGKYGVTGYPTLKVFKHGQHDEYNGPREADGIVKYMKSKAGPSSRELKTLEEIEKFIAGDEHGILGFFESDTDDAKQFQKLADALNEDFRFAHTYAPELLEKYEYKNDVVIFRAKRLKNKFDESALKYDGAITLTSLKNWVNNNIHGLAGHRTTGNSAQFKGPTVVAYYDVDYVKNPKGTNYWRNRVLKVAKKFVEAEKTVTFAVSSKEEFSQELGEYGLEALTDKPVIAARNLKDQKFVMEGEFSMDTLEQFVNDFLDDKIKPYLKSEPIPDNTNNAVKVAVGENFNELVNDETKDVLIEFYAPWCGHCKNLAPKYEELATKLADEDEIVIVKMDATANDVPSPYEVRGFPTIFFSPAGSKGSPKKYEGGREVKDFIKYLAAESTNPLKGYNRDGKKKKTKKVEL